MNLIGWWQWRVTVIYRTKTDALKILVQVLTANKSPLEINENAKKDVQYHFKLNFNWHEYILNIFQIQPLLLGIDKPTKWKCMSERFINFEDSFVIA